MTRKESVGSPEWTDLDDAPELPDQMRDSAEVFQSNTFIRHARARPQTGHAKEQISVRLDPDAIATLRKDGPGRQSQINAIPRKALHLNGRKTA